MRWHELFRGVVKKNTNPPPTPEQLANRPPPPRSQVAAKSPRSDTMNPGRTAAAIAQALGLDIQSMISLKFELDRNQCTVEVRSFVHSDKGDALGEELKKYYLCPQGEL